MDHPLGRPSVIARPTPLRFANQVWPSAGDVPIGCGCGSFRFRAHGQADPIASCVRVTEMVCANCLKVFKLDPANRRGGQLHEGVPPPAAG